MVYLAGMAEALRNRVRFGPFQADLVTGELTRNGVRRRLPGQPFEVLSLLLERPGDLVTRDELRRRLWPEDTFVDFDHGLNAAVNKLREALGDSAERPRYGETVPRRGYRLIVPVEAVTSEPQRAPALPDEPPAPEAVPAAPVNAAPVEAAPVAAEPVAAAPRRSRKSLVRAGMAVLALAVVAAVASFLLRRSVVATSALVAGRAAASKRQAIRSLAVLPFEDLSRGAEEPYFADGMTEAVLQRLSSIASLRIASRTSVMPYRERRLPLAEIAAQLHVDAVVEGAVQREGSRVRISVKLIRIADDRTLWANAYEREMADVLTLQNDVARTIGEEIHGRLTAAEWRELSRARRVDPQAYQAYLKGRFYQRKASTEANVKGAESFREAIRLDPGYAPAHVGLADSEVFLWPPADAMPRAKAAALKALALDPELPGAHAALGLVKTYGDWDWAGAEASFRRALQLDPRSAEAHYRFSLLLCVVGRFEEAIEHGRRAADLEPLSPNERADLGRVYFFARRNREAVVELSRALELDPTYRWAIVFLSRVHEVEGRFEDSLALWERKAALTGVDAAEVVLLREAFRKGGHDAMLERIVEQERLQPKSSVSHVNIARHLIRLRRTDESFAALEEAFAVRGRDLIYLGVDPGFDPVRDDPRFADMLRRLGLPR